jgi:hypothetical protein
LRVAGFRLFAAVVFFLAVEPARLVVERARDVPDVERARVVPERDELERDVPVRDVVFFARDAAGFARDVVDLARDVVAAFARDVVGFAREVDDFARDVVDLARDVVDLARDVVDFGFARDVVGFARELPDVERAREVPDVDRERDAVPLEDRFAAVVRPPLLPAAFFAVEPLRLDVERDELRDVPELERERLVPLDLLDLRGVAARTRVIGSSFCSRSPSVASASGSGEYPKPGPAKRSGARSSLGSWW